ncbi:serine hydrolase [Devosia sp. D6-9]|nr:serine hydrolase [Devosia sp. D6-9]
MVDRVCFRGLGGIGLAMLLAAPVLAQETQDSRVDAAIAQLDDQIRALMEETRVPGLAIAVVKNGETVFERGYGVRNLETGEPVTPETVFQLASMSKPVGASVIASVIADGKVGWDTKVREIFPWFTLGDPWVSANVTIGDLYSHRTGLPDHAGDDLEQFDYSQRQVFDALRYLPLGAFRASYAYTNYGMTLAAEAVATIAGEDWADLSRDRLYIPLGMTSTSSRFDDFRKRPNHAVGHVWEEGQYVVGPERTKAGLSHWSSAYNTDRTSPAAGVSSTAVDLARWMAFMLADGRTEKLSIPAAALTPMVTPKSMISEAPDLRATGGYYGYGMFLSSPVPGHVVWSHGGAFSWGSATAMTLIPDANVGIVVLVNATPNGVADAITAQFTDIVLAGNPTRDWWTIYKAGLAPVLEPQGRLAKLRPPDPARPAQSPSAYAGRYENAYFGDLEIAPGEGDALLLKFGPEGQVQFTARHWDADTFVFEPFNDAQLLGSLSAVDFSGDRVTIEAYDDNGLGTFVRKSD